MNQSLINYSGISVVTNHVRHPVLTFDALALVRLGFLGAGTTEKTPVPGIEVSNDMVGFGCVVCVIVYASVSRRIGFTGKRAR